MERLGEASSKIGSTCRLGWGRFVLLEVWRTWTVGPEPEGETTMRFMMFMIPNATAEAGILPDPEFFAAMSRFNEELQKAGALISLDGLQPSAKGARVAFRGKKTIVTDGPFTESKEVIGGFWMIQVASKAEAVEWAKRCPAAEGDTIEVRQVQELSDFPDALIEAARDAAGPSTRA